MKAHPPKRQIREGFLPTAPSLFSDISRFRWFVELFLASGDGDGFSKLPSSSFGFAFFVAGSAFSHGRRSDLAEK